MNSAKTTLTIVGEALLLVGELIKGHGGHGGDMGQALQRRCIGACRRAVAVALNMICAWNFVTNIQHRPPRVMTWFMSCGRRYWCGSRYLLISEYWTCRRCCRFTGSSSGSSRSAVEI